MIIIIRFFFVLKATTYFFVFVTFVHFKAQNGNFSLRFLFVLLFGRVGQRCRRQFNPFIHYLLIFNQHKSINWWFHVDFYSKSINNIKFYWMKYYDDWLTICVDVIRFQLELMMIWLWKKFSPCWGSNPGCSGGRQWHWPLS